MPKNIIIIASIIGIVGLIGWAWWESNKPMPGTQVADLGRGHVPIGTEVSYNSNPPTSGPHYEDWIRAGVYQDVKDDRNLVHSLEHGYIVMSYNCAFKETGLLSVYAHGLDEPNTSSATTSAALLEEFRSDDCHSLVDQLISIFESKGKRKLIVLPRPNLDSKIALTAWRRIDKFNEFDASRIKKFIDTYRDHGPEQTME